MLLSVSLTLLPEDNNVNDTDNHDNVTNDSVD